MMEIDYINGPKTDKIFGISKYQMEIIKRLDIDLNIIEFNSLMSLFEKKFTKNSRSESEDMGNILNHENSFLKYLTDKGKKTFKTIDSYHYTMDVKKKVKGDNKKHITTQELAYIQNSLEMEKTIITCHDLIPWVYDKDRSKFWKNNINGLKKADALITVSEFSKNEIIKHLDFPPENIHIVKDAVDHSTYYQNPNKKILSKRHIPLDKKVVLYVGSEMPRMNVHILIKAFKLLKERISDIILIKIGDTQNYGARGNLLKIINVLDLKEDVKFMGYVPEEDMPKWYNAADVLVYPCDYAGFGLPPLEAMACGTPVITSNTSSLPEVVGDAGIMINPTDSILMADKMYELLKDEILRNEMINKGLIRSKMFQWDDAAKKTLEIYENLV